MTTKNQNPGNFANDREKAREAGRKGGQATASNHGRDSHQQTAQQGKSRNSH